MENPTSTGDFFLTGGSWCGNPGEGLDPRLGRQGLGGVSLPVSAQSPLPARLAALGFSG